jgi:hypothetical protein
MTPPPSSDDTIPSKIPNLGSPVLTAYKSHALPSPMTPPPPPPSHSLTLFYVQFPSPKRDSDNCVPAPAPPKPKLLLQPAKLTI